MSLRDLRDLSKSPRFKMDHPQISQLSPPGGNHVRSVAPGKRPISSVDTVYLIVAWLAVLGLYVLCDFLARQDSWRRLLVLGARCLLSSTVSQHCSLSYRSLRLQQS